MKIYFNNYDWPLSNNMVWNINNQTKWKHLFYDIDAGWGYKGPHYNMMEHATKETDTQIRKNMSRGTFIFRELLKFDIFKNNFLERFACLMQNEFHQDTVIKAINLFSEIYKPAISEHLSRWQIHNNLNAYEKVLNNKLISFAKQRQKFIIKHISDKFGINYDIHKYKCSVQQKN